MDALKELLLFVGNWMVANPPWFIGIVVVIALLLWYFLHALPKKKNERQLQQYMLEKSNREEEAKCAKQQYIEKKKADEAIQKSMTDEAARLAQEKRDLAEQSARQNAGRDFELRIVELLEKELDAWIKEGRTKLLYNVTLPMNGYQTQIDAVLIDTSGIYVIECKCWDRLIVGKHGWPYWLAIKVVLKNNVPVVSENGQTFYCQAFKSPIEQNEEHKISLSFFLKQNTNKKFNQFKRITVFDTCGGTSFILPSEGRPNQHSDPYTWVGKKDKLIAEIREFDKTIPTLSRLEIQDVDLIFNELKPHAESFADIDSGDCPSHSTCSSTANSFSLDHAWTPTTISGEDERAKKDREELENQEEERKHRDDERASLLQQQLITAEDPTKKRSVKQRLEDAERQVAEQAAARALEPTTSLSQSKNRTPTMHR